MFYCSQDGILKYESSLVDFCYDLIWDLACSTTHHILILARARPRPVHLYNIYVFFLSVRALDSLFKRMFLSVAHCDSSFPLLLLLLCFEIHVIVCVFYIKMK
jgi:hypothetical protein